MNKSLLKQLFATVTFFALSIQMFAFGVNAQSLKTETKETAQMDDQPQVEIKQSKIAPDLEEKSNNFMFGGQADERMKVIIQLRPETDLNEMFGDEISPAEKQQLLAQEVRGNKAKAGILMADLVESGGVMKRAYYNLGLVSAELPLSQINKLVQSNEVAYISPDREVRSFGHIGSTTGWSNTGINDNGDNDPNTWLTGAYGHIVVIDSGIDTSHNLMRWMDTGGQAKVKYSKDFTGQGITGDPFGHGTHVASMFGGDWVLGGAAYEGVADGASIINLRVLNSTGSGSVSNLIAALDWTVANKTAWSIRAINMSLGTAAKDSYKNDPLCQAARRAVNAGIVVVASAGNFGKDLFGNKLYGTIGSPGIEPSVITVGAVNTFGTDGRSDDTVASFSSRGPTRGYVTLSNGARKYDNLIKPDIVATGNKLIGARAYHDGIENLLARTFTSLRTGSATANSEKVMYLSGTSMAAPVVAGAAMNLVQVNPKLTPNLIKAILMYSAQPIKNANTLEQGAGQLNIDGAVRLARLVKTTLPTTNGSALLKSSLPTSQTSTIAGQTVTWGKGVITNHGFLHGNDLMTKWQGMYANGVLMADATPLSGTTLTRSTTLTQGTNMTLYQGAITNNGTLVSDGTLYLSANAMGGSPTPFVNSQGILVSDGVLVGDGVLLADGVLLGDGYAYSTSLLGDNTACMMPAP